MFRHIFERDGDTPRRFGRNARPNILLRARLDGGTAMRPRPDKSKLSIWEDEEFSNQYNRKGHINGIATESKNAVGYETVGMVSVNADSKALPKGNQAPQEQQQPRQAKQHSGPRDYLGMEKLVRRHSRPVECRGEQDIEIEQGKWRDQEIRLVDMTEFHRFYALFSQDRDSGQYHPKQQNDRQDSEIFCHRSSRIARVRPVPQWFQVPRSKALGRQIGY